MNELVDRWTRPLDRDGEREFVEREGSVNEIAVGTVLEYDDWQWAVVTELAADRDEPMFGFVLTDELGDSVIKRLEKAVGCRQHYAAVEEYRDGEHEYWSPVDYIVENDIWSVLGPVHPDHRDTSGNAPDRSDEK